MPDYKVTSTNFDGFLFFSFDTEDVLKRFENHATLTVDQQKFLHSNFPFTVQDMGKINGPGATIEIHEDLTFDKFWESYGKKRGKREAQIQWVKLSDKDKHKALQYITKYRYNCKLEGIEMLYPERYIKKRRWEDEE